VGSTPRLQGAIIRCGGERVPRRPPPAAWAEAATASPAWTGPRC